MFAVPTGLVVELVVHAASAPRADWDGEDSARPLSAEGRRQADDLATAIGVDLDAVYSSPARRCIQTVEPLVRSCGMTATIDPDLMTPDGRYEPTAWTEGMFAPMGQLLGGASMAGKALASLARMRAAHPGGRVVACSHGDVIPALLAFLISAQDQPPPVIPNRGGWYRLQFGSNELEIHSHPAP